MHFAPRNSAVEDVPRCAQMSKRHCPKRFFLFVVAREFQRKSMNTSLFETFVGCGLRSCKLQRSVTLQLHVDSDSQTCGHQPMAVHLHDNVNSPYRRRQLCVWGMLPAAFLTVCSSQDGLASYRHCNNLVATIYDHATAHWICNAVFAIQPCLNVLHLCLLCCSH